MPTNTNPPDPFLTITTSRLLSTPVEEWTAIDYLTALGQRKAARDARVHVEALAAAIKASAWTFDAAKAEADVIARAECHNRERHTDGVRCLVCGTR